MKAPQKQETITALLTDLSVQEISSSKFASPFQVYTSQFIQC